MGPEADLSHTHGGTDPKNGPRTSGNTLLDIDKAIAGMV
jgi:hypothetical protein